MHIIDDYSHRGWEAFDYMRNLGNFAKSNYGLRWVIYH